MFPNTGLAGTAIPLLTHRHPFVVVPFFVTLASIRFAFSLSAAFRFVVCCSLSARLLPLLLFRLLAATFSSRIPRFVLSYSVIIESMLTITCKIRISRTHSFRLPVQLLLRTLEMLLNMVCISYCSVVSEQCWSCCYRLVCFESCVNEKSK